MRKKNGFLGCVTSVYKKECLFLFAGNGDDRKIQHEIAEFWDAIGFEGEIISTEEVCADNIRRELRSGSVDLPHDTEETALDIFKKAVKMPDFGNGRFVRNVLEQAQMRLSGRLSTECAGTLTNEQLTALCAEDFEQPVMCAEISDHRAIGF